MEQNTLDEMARRIQEIASKFGWRSDINKLVQRVKQWNDGLIHEDEFIYLLNWSGQCKLAHKLDQVYIPPASKKKHTIPDLFVSFKNGQSYFIEIKTTAENNKLSWKEDYYNGLINYSKLFGIPVLVAWKWRSFDIWTLFELSHFKKKVSNYKIGFEEAHIRNLMSTLVGDYVIFPYEHIGLHFKFKKVSVKEQEDNSTTWNVISERIYFTGKNNKEVEATDSGLFFFLLSFPMDEQTEETDTHIIQSFIPSPNKSAFAQSVPIRLSRALSDGEIDWIGKIKKQEFPIKYDTLYRSLQKGISDEIIERVIRVEPKSD
jgi:Holliday junction resolvase